MDIYAKSSEWHLGYSDYYNTRECPYENAMKKAAWQEGYNYAQAEDEEAQMNAEDHPPLS